MLLELAIGDAYGAGFEYVDSAVVRRHNNVKDYVQHPRHKLLPGRYTDDTQMSIAIAETLVSGRPWTSEALADSFVECFRRDRREGYSKKFYDFLLTVKDGNDFLGRIDPRSDKSGAAMRATPIGILFPLEKVLEFAVIQARTTHDTPDGIAAACASALTAHYFIYSYGPKADVGEFVQEHISGDWAKPWEGNVGAKGLMSVRAAITAIAACHGMKNLLKRCIEFTGDVDTVAAIALAAGSYADEIDQDLPQTLINGLETGPFGQQYLSSLDQKLTNFLAREMNNRGR